MRAADLLRQLDGRVLPRLAQVLAEVGQGPLRLRVLTWTAVLSAAAVLSTLLWTVDRQPLGGAGTVGDVARVGVAQGESVPRYVETARGELAALASPGEPATETYALVTLATYLTPERLGPAVSGAPVAEVFGRVSLPDAQPQIVRIPAPHGPDDVVAGMAEVARRKDREVADYTARADAVPDGDPARRELRSFYQSSALLAAAEAAAYRSGCSCLYAAVVRATPQVLSRVAGRPEVRAVDPAPEVTRLDRAVFTPPLPEQTDLIRPPTDAATPGTTDAGPATPPSGANPGGPPTGQTPPSVVPSVAPPPPPSPSVSPVDGPAPPTNGPTSTDSGSPGAASPPSSVPTAVPSDSGS